MKILSLDLNEICIHLVAKAFYGKTQQLNCSLNQKSQKRTLIFQFCVVIVIEFISIHKKYKKKLQSGFNIAKGDFKVYSTEIISKELL